MKRGKIFSQSGRPKSAGQWERDASAPKIKGFRPSKTNTGKYFYILFFVKLKTKNDESLAGGNLNNLTGIKRRNISF